MPILLAVHIPDHKRGVIGLTYIYGIGKSLAEQILNKANISHHTKAGEWTDAQIKQIRATIIKDYTTGSHLRTKVLLDIKRLKDIPSYRGKRHRMGLPSRGQNTKNNARTCKKRTSRTKPTPNKRKK